MAGLITFPMEVVGKVAAELFAIVTVVVLFDNDETVICGTPNKDIVTAATVLILLSSCLRAKECKCCYRVREFHKYYRHISK